MHRSTNTTSKIRRNSEVSAGLERRSQTLNGFKLTIEFNLTSYPKNNQILCQSSPRTRCANNRMNNRFPLPFFCSTWPRAGVTRREIPTTERHPEGCRSVRPKGPDNVKIGMSLEFYSPAAAVSRNGAAGRGRFPKRRCVPRRENETREPGSLRWRRARAARRAPNATRALVES